MARVALEREIGTERWDWHCGTCANIVYARRRACRCGGARKDGYTFAGSIRGVSQSTAHAHDARDLQ